MEPIDSPWNDATGLHRLHEAARTGSWEAIAPALAAGADVDLRARRGDDKCFPYEGATLLHLAAWGGQGETCALLLRRGAAVDARTERGDTPLLYAAFSGEPGAAAVIGTLLAEGADPDAVDAVTGRCALHWLATRGDMHAIGILLRRGATAMVVGTTFGSTPLHAAAQGGHVGVARMLLDAGVDPGHRDQLGRTALDIAHADERAELVSLLAD